MLSPPKENTVPSPSRRRDASFAGFTLVELLVVIAIIGVLVALLLPAVQAARESARRSQCQSNLRNVSLAVLNYEAAKGVAPQGMTFPKSFAPSLGTLQVYNANWIISVLPYLEQQATYNAFDLKQRINYNSGAPANNRNYNARGIQLDVLLCPTDPFNRVLYQGPAVVHGDNWARTNYAGNAGGAYLLGGCGSPELCASGPDTPGWESGIRRGVMGPNTSVEFRQITDGASNTILVGEIRTGYTNKDARGVWAMGHAGASLLAMFGSNGDANGPNACYTYSDDVYSDICDTPDAQAQCFTCYAGNAFAQAAVRSYHSGGANISMCDGSVTFISDDVETSGYFGSWGSVWDHMIASADDGATQELVP